MILAISITTFWSSESDSLPTSCTISESESSCCRISQQRLRSMEYCGSISLKNGSSTRMYLVYEMSQLTLGKCLRCASFLSRPQKTCRGGARSF